MNGDLRSILFADVVGSTATYRRLGDAAAERLIHQAMQRAEGLATLNGGRLVKTIGDCALCELPSPSAAARVAMELHRMSVVPLSEGEESVSFRVGFAHGAVVDRGQDVFGDVVNLAARLCDIAKSGQILTTEATAEFLDAEIRGGVRLFDQAALKGFAETLSVVQLLWDRRAATQIFVMPEMGPSVGLSRLQLAFGADQWTLDPSRLPFALGREASCDLVVPAVCVSRVHARIEQHRGKFVLVDESTNGTYVLPEASPSERAVYLRRESFALLGRGVIALGERPSADSAHLIRYEIV